MWAGARAQLVDMLHFCDAMCAISSVRLDKATLSKISEKLC